MTLMNSSSLTYPDDRMTNSTAPCAPATSSRLRTQTSAYRPDKAIPLQTSEVQKRRITATQKKRLLCTNPFNPSYANERPKMQNFPVQTIESAPEQSKSALQNLQMAFGMIPNIAGAIATSPVLINSLVGLFQRVHGGSFTEAQIQTILLTNAVTNACSWAVAFHTALA